MAGIVVSDDDNNIIVRETENKIILQTSTRVNYVAAGTKIYFDGDGGNTYIWYNTAISGMEIVVNGTKVKSWY